MKTNCLFTIALQVWTSTVSLALEFDQFVIWQPRWCHWRCKGWVPIIPYFWTHCRNGHVYIYTWPHRAHGLVWRTIRLFRWSLHNNHNCFHRFSLLHQLLFLIPYHYQQSNLIVIFTHISLRFHWFLLIGLFIFCSYFTYLLSPSLFLYHCKSIVNPHHRSRLLIIPFWSLYINFIQNRC